MMVMRRIANSWQGTFGNRRQGDYDLFNSYKADSSGSTVPAGMYGVGRGGCLKAGWPRTKVGLSHDTFSDRTTLRLIRVPDRDVCKSLSIDLLVLGSKISSAAVSLTLTPEWHNWSYCENDKSTSSSRLH